MLSKLPSRRVLIAVVATALAALTYIVYERPRVTDVPFAELPVERAEANAFVAPEGFPDCTLAMLDLQIEDTAGNVDVTFRPKPGVQCGIREELASWWVDAAGERFDPPPARTAHNARILLMGKAGASDVGGIETACGMKTPITYFIEVAGEPFEVGSIEKTECWGKRVRLYGSFLTYRGGGLETPAGWLDPTIEAPEATEGEIHFDLALRNDTDEDIVLSRCPFIDVEFVTSTAGAEVNERGYRTFLNCPAAPDRIEPGDVVRFAIAVPGAAIGTGRLEVELRDENRVIHRITSAEIEVAS